MSTYWDKERARAIRWAHEIGAALRESRGGTGHPPELVRWAESFTYWEDVVSALGNDGATAALVAGHRDGPRECQACGDAAGDATGLGFVVEEGAPACRDCHGADVEAYESSHASPAGLAAGARDMREERPRSDGSGNL